MAARYTVPSHVLVQKQLEDVFLIQQDAVKQLHDTSINREATISKTEYDSLSSRYESLKIHYDEAVQELSEEKLQSANLKKQLKEVTDRLEFALGEIEILTKQIGREKMQFQKTFGILQTKTTVVSAKKEALESKCAVIEDQCEKQSSTLESKEKEIEKLNKKLHEQRKDYDKQMNEVNILQQQEQYIQKMLGEKDKSKTKKKLTS